jgi:tryptophan synthase beta chain
MQYDVNQDGYYGDFGGAFIPEMLYANVEELRQKYLGILEDEEFRDEFTRLLRDKINNTVGQILMAKRLGKQRIIAETGAGQHGVATATVCALMGMECIVYMGDTDVKRQQPNVLKMKMLGASVVSVQSGNKTLKDATNEAIRDWINHPEDTHYIIGSVVGPHPYPDLVTKLQAVIGEEISWQIREQTGKEIPDCIIACVGGGSNAMGAFYPFLGNKSVRMIGVEAAGKGTETDPWHAEEPGSFTGAKPCSCRMMTGRSLNHILFQRDSTTRG